MQQRFAIAVLLFGAIIAGSGCQETTSSRSAQQKKSNKANRATSLRTHLGDICQVQFRRDALGAAASNPIPPTTGNINGADVTVVGKLTDIAPEAVVVSSDVNPPQDYWIPVSSILMIKFEVLEENPSSSQQSEH